MFLFTVTPSTRKKKKYIMEKDTYFIISFNVSIPSTACLNPSSSSVVSSCNGLSKASFAMRVRFFMTHSVASSMNWLSMNTTRGIPSRYDNPCTIMSKPFLSSSSIVLYSWLAV